MAAVRSAWLRLAGVGLAVAGLVVASARVMLPLYNSRYQQSRLFVTPMARLDSRAVDYRHGYQTRAS
jgi:hypothetical protein